MTDEAYGDPTTAAWWEAARGGVLLLQRCGRCGSHQHYPRPFCLTCESADLHDVAATGRATVHSRTTVHLRVEPDLEPPYVVAVVALAEGPRLTTLLLDDVPIGAQVRLTWRVRPGGLPPLPVFDAPQP